MLQRVVGLKATSASGRKQQCLRRQPDGCECLMDMSVDVVSPHEALAPRPDLTATDVDGDVARRCLPGVAQDNDGPLVIHLPELDQLAPEVIESRVHGRCPFTQPLQTPIRPAFGHGERRAKLHVWVEAHLGQRGEVASIQRGEYCLRLRPPVLRVSVLRHRRAVSRGRRTPAGALLLWTKSGSATW